MTKQEIKRVSTECVLESEELIRVARSYKYSLQTEKEDLTKRAHTVELAGFMLLNHNALNTLPVARVATQLTATATGEGNGT